MPPGTGEPGDGGADQGGLHDVVVAAHRDRAVPLADPQLHGGDHYALRAEPPDLAFQLAPGFVPRLADELGPARDFGVARPPADLTGRGPVIVPGPDRDAQREACRHPARHDQLGEILPAQITGERLPPPECGPWRTHRGAEGGELHAAERERPPGQPHAHHPVPAELGTLGGHPVDGRMTRLVHGLHQRAEGPLTAVGRGATGPGGGRGRVYGRAEHLPDGLEARATHGGELAGGQRGPPRAAGPDLRHPGRGYGRQLLPHTSSLGSGPIGQFRRSGRRGETRS
jgi:hypothetical protein